MSEWIATEIGRIPNRWGIGTLGQVSQFITDGSHSSPKPIQSEYLMASVKDMRYNRFDFSDCKTISKDDFETLEKSNCAPQYGDILLSKDGANCLDLIFVYRQKEKIVLLSSIAIARLKEGFDSDFVRYFLLSPNVQYLMRNNYVSGSAIPRVILKDFKNVPVPLPPYNEQKAISSLLSSLDDKIDLLHRQNKTLEQIAETLFRQWFIEEAKEDWGEGELGDLIEVKYGKDHKKLLDGNIPVYGSGGIMRFADTVLYGSESVLIPRKGTLNNVIYINEPFWTVDTMFYTIMKKPNLAKFIYHFLNRQDLAAMNVGSAVPSMTTNILNCMPLLLPPDEVLEKFEQSAGTIYTKMKSNNKQIHTLENLRDMLLPKLMSGEVRVII